MRLLTAIAFGVLAPTTLFAQSASIAGTDGTRSVGHLPCAAEDGVALSDCPFEVLPKEDGSVSIRVLLPGGQVRFLYVEGGEVTATDALTNMGSKRLQNRTVVHIPPAERFEIPNSVIDAK